MSSVVIAGSLTGAACTAHGSPSVYRDEQLGFRLTVPAGWQVSSFTADSDGLSTFGGVALWNFELPDPPNGWVNLDRVPPDGTLVQLGGNTHAAGSDDTGFPLDLDLPNSLGSSDADHYVTFRVHGTSWEFISAIGDDADQADRDAVAEVAASLRFDPLPAVPAGRLVRHPGSSWMYLAGDADRFPVGSVTELRTPEGSPYRADAVWLVHSSMGFYALASGTCALRWAPPHARFVCPGGEAWDLLGRSIGPGRYLPAFAGGVTYDGQLVLDAAYPTLSTSL